MRSREEIQIEVSDFTCFFFLIHNRAKQTLKRGGIVATAQEF